MIVYLPPIERFPLRLNGALGAEDLLAGIRYEGSRKRLLAQIAKRYARYANERG